MRGHLLHDLGGADERALLAVQELRELPAWKCRRSSRRSACPEPLETVEPKIGSISSGICSGFFRDRGPATSRCDRPHPLRRFPLA
jgi:hypothetical protein